MANAISFKGERVRVQWSDNAFPEQIFVDETPVLASGTKWLSCRLGDGRIAVPFLGERSFVEAKAEKDRTTVFVDRAMWRDASGAVIPDFRVDLRFELWQDGTTFVNFYFLGESCSAPDIESFSLDISPDVKGYDEVLWGIVREGKGTDAANLLPVETERFLPPGQDREVDGGIIVNTTFDCFTPGRPAVHCEFFVEGHSTLSGKEDGCSASVKWRDGLPVIHWDFQKPEYKSCHERPWQLRNQIGWLITPPPTKRRLPPLRMYHYFSNQSRYPSVENIRKMAAAGGDVLTMHENWRADTINGGVPYDIERLREVVRTAHECGMRVALYIRGNEQSEVEECTDWYSRFLDPAFGDGLYMDFGGAYALKTPPYIDYVGGRVHLRGWYLAARARRERVGEDGVVFAHSGTTYSAIGMTGGLITGYVSGEGERGLVIKSRKNHAYFTKSRAVCGTMWTAAFPEYGSPAMVPYMASTGQFPHNPLGAQFETSSLTHPDEPGVNDVYLRPLWKLWGIYRGEKDISIGTWDNGCSTVKVDSEKTGFYLMGTSDAKTYLCILSNFDTASREISAKLSVPLPARAKAFLLKPDSVSPGKVVSLSGWSEVKTSIEGLGVAAVLVTEDPDVWEGKFAEFEKAYPAQTDYDKAWLADVALQKKLRETPPEWDEVWMRISVPNLSTPYEESLWWDLFANQAELVRFTGEDGSYESLGWITPESNLLQPAKPESDPQIPPVPGDNDAGIVWPGHSSPWISLRGILPAGSGLVGVRSVIARLGISTYSFLTVTLSPKPEENAEGAYTLKFYNDLEPNREFVRWRM